ncbi:hypothetical protein IWX78_003082 [Mycetocola sp. CAN_C7]
MPWKNLCVSRAGDGCHFAAIHEHFYTLLQILRIRMPM